MKNRLIWLDWSVLVTTTTNDGQDERVITNHVYELISRISRYPWLHVSWSQVNPCDWRPVKNHCSRRANLTWLCSRSGKNCWILGSIVMRDSEIVIICPSLTHLRSNCDKNSLQLSCRDAIRCGDNSRGPRFLCQTEEAIRLKFWKSCYYLRSHLYFTSTAA